MKLRILAAALFLLGIICLAQQTRAQLTMTGVGGGFGASGATYTGPIDFNGAAFAFWSTRPGSAALAAAGQKLFNVCDVATGLVCNDAVATSSGGVTLPATPVCGSCEIATVYDQSGGNNCNLSTAPCDVSAAHGNRPTLTVSCQNSKPCLVFTRASSQCLITGTNTSTQAAPVSGTAVGLVTNGATGQNALWANFNSISSSVDGANTWWLTLGGNSGTATDGVFHAVQITDTAEKQYIDGALNPTSGAGFGATGFSPAPLSIGGTGGCSSGFLGGDWLESGLWLGDKSTLFSSVNGNQHTFWSF